MAEIRFLHINDEVTAKIVIEKRRTNTEWNLKWMRPEADVVLLDDCQAFFASANLEISKSHINESHL